MPADNGKKNSIVANMKIREEEEDEKKEDEDEALKIWDCGSPLYDSYELVALNHVIDRHLMELPCLSGSRKDIIISHESSHAEAATSNKVKGSSMKNFFSGLMERKVGWKRKHADGGRREEPKKVKWGIIKICNRINSWKKISYKDK